MYFLKLAWWCFFFGCCFFKRMSWNFNIVHDDLLLKWSVVQHCKILGSDSPRWMILIIHFGEMILSLTNINISLMVNRFGISKKLISTSYHDGSFLRNLTLLIVVNVRNGSWGKVMFSQISFILSRGRRGSRYPRGG